MTFLAAFVFALTQGDSSLESRVTGYAFQLRDDATRDRARDRLVHLGKAGLAALEKLEVDPVLLASIREEVALNDSLGASYGPPHLFTFDGSEESLGVLLSRLETAAGAPFQKNNIDAGQKVSVKAEDVTFWEALDAICNKAAIWYMPATDPLYITGGGMASPKPRVYYGPTMIVMDRVQHLRRVTFNEIESDFSIRLILVWEKSISPLGATFRYKLSRVTDDTGASLIPAAPKAPATRTGVLVRNPGAGVDLSGLKPPSPDAKKLAIVEGTLELEFPKRVDEVRFDVAGDAAIAALPQAKTVPGVRVELKSLAPQGAWGAAAEVAVRFDDPKEAADFRIGGADVDFLSGPDNKRNTCWIGSARVEKDTYTFTTNWRNGGRSEMPREIRVRVPRGGVIKNIPFSFRDVELK